MRQRALNMLKKLPLIYLLQTGWQYAGRYRPLLLLSSVLFVLAQAVSLAEPYVIGRLLNCLQSDVAKNTGAEALKHDVFFYLGLFFAIQVAAWLFHGPGRLLERYTQFKIQLAFKTRLFEIVTLLPMQWQRDHHSGDTIDKINRASKSLGEFWDTTFEVSYMLLRLIGTIGILFFFMPAAAWVAAATSVVSITIVFLFDRVLTRQYSALNLMDNRVAAAVHDYITNIVSVITLRLEESVLEEVRRRMLKPLPVFKLSNTLNETKWCLNTMVITSMIVIVLIWYADTTLAAGKTLLIGTFFTLFEYLRRIGDSFYNFCYIYSTNVRQATDVQSAEPLFSAYTDLQLHSQHGILPPAWRTISIRHLHFTYEDEKHRTHHLEDVSLELNRGQSIAIVGESGSGKSTLLNLLRGMHSTDRVEVICDDKVLPGGLAHLNHSTTLMPQDPEIFADTVRFNICFGFEATTEELDRAIEIARFTSVLEKLPNGLDTNIAEKGVNLSGGEKQRLALARGVFFAKNSSIILLDEPTSSVDTSNERQIYERILSQFSDSCIMSSIHKLHLLEMFDMIYVFEDGVIVERGTFTELVAGGGPLSRSWKAYQRSSVDSIESAGQAMEPSL